MGTETRSLPSLWSGHWRRVLACMLLAGLALLGAQPAVAQTVVSEQITPLGNSNVAGMLSLWAEPAGPTMLSVSVKGLTPGSNAQVNLNSGTCSLPSASVLRVLTLTADATGRATSDGQVLLRDGVPMPLADVADGQHVIIVVAGNAAVACGVIPQMPAADLTSALLAEGERRQVMQFNPGAALQRRILADRFVPNSAEFSLVLEATSFAVQRAEHLGTGAVRVYFARTGDWGNVRFAQRGAAPDALGTFLLGEAERMQVIQFNPRAALQRQIFADGFVPNSGEFVLQVGGAEYTAQRAEHLGTGRVRVYYAVTGRWNDVRYVERAGGGPGSGMILAIAPASGPSGTLVRLSGTGFPPNVLVTAWGGPVNSEGTQLATGMTDANGSVSLDVQVQGQAGMRWVFGLVAGEVHAQSPEFSITE